jgi:hypothetical protein
LLKLFVDLERANQAMILKGCLRNALTWRAMSALEEIVKKALKSRRGKDYLEKAHQKLYDRANEIAQELEEEIQKGRFDKESLDEKAVNGFIQYYALDNGIELDEKLSWHSCRI